MQDLTSPTRDGTCALCSGNTVLTTGPSWKSQESLTQSPGKFSGSVLVDWAVLSPSVLSDSCDPIDCNLPGSSVHGILQARVLEWVAVSFSRHLPNPGLLHCTQTLYRLSYSSVQPLSRVRLFVAPWAAARQASLSIPTPGAYSNSCLIS